MKEEKIKSEIKMLYKKDKGLAQEVASVLGYTIEAKKAKAPVNKNKPKPNTAPKDKNTSSKGKDDKKKKKGKKATADDQSMQEKVKAEIKELYGKDKGLAKEVAEVLGYKIEAKKASTKNLGKGPKGLKKTGISSAKPKKVSVPNKINSPKVKKGGK